METWLRTELKVLDQLSASLQIQVSYNDVERIHRLLLSAIENAGKFSG